MNFSSYDKQRWSDKNLSALQGKVAVITGSSRGIGLYCAKRLAKQGAHIIILSKTTQSHPKLPGTIYTAQKQIQEMGGEGKVVPIACDLRKQVDVQNAVKIIKQTFGKIDILVNNASAIDLSPTLKISTKKFDLMNTVNTRGTFMLTKYCLPLLIKSPEPFLINITPPLSMLSTYPIGQKGLPYILTKIGMSMIVLGISHEYPQIKCCGLWPRKTIATAAVKNAVGTNQEINRSRTSWILADALYFLLTDFKNHIQSNFFYDDQIILKKGLKVHDYFMTKEEIAGFKQMFTQQSKPKL